MTTEMIMDLEQKQTADYYVALVVIVSWFRYFVYLLAIQPVSRLLLTLVNMIKDTGSFAFIMFCYLLISATIFMTLFQAPAPDLYGSFSLTMRTMFDYSLGEYSNEQIAYKNGLHDYLQVAFLVISVIFMVNYLIAIITTVYEDMRFHGNFLYKANKYAYIEKYQIAQSPRNEGCGLVEYVINPAPVNLLTLFLLPFTLTENRVSFSEMFGRSIYWIETIIMAILLMVYLIVLLPIIYLKMLWHLFKATRIYNFIWIGPLWVSFGAILLPIYLVKDLMYFFKIN